MFGDTIHVLHNALNLRVQRQQVISSNIANSDTPGYAPARLDFEQQLQNSLSDSEVSLTSSDPKHYPVHGEAPEVQGSVSREPSLSRIGDKNNVSLDQEMQRLSENQIKYEATTKMLRKKFSTLQNVLQK
ncbi:MAG: flagellar basal body rod protein FlgB [Desulfohalobiaceae bacterium]|nr:flagellar basal body rod protein FlgB [Desulfohalobiaceae bacterium]